MAPHMGHSAINSAASRRVSNSKENDDSCIWPSIGWARLPEALREPAQPRLRDDERDDEADEADHGENRPTTRL